MFFLLFIPKNDVITTDIFDFFQIFESVEKELPFSLRCFVPCWVPDSTSDLWNNSCKSSFTDNIQMRLEKNRENCSFENYFSPSKKNVNLYLCQFSWSCYCPNFAFKICLFFSILFNFQEKCKIVLLVFFSVTNIHISLQMEVF